LTGAERPPESFWDELEEVLIEADVGVATADRLVARARDRVEREGANNADEVVALLRNEMAPLLRTNGASPPLGHPHVILMVGVNGVGKTTTIAKLAYLYQQEGRRVLLAAADTFRAAAIDQLREWAQRLASSPTSRRRSWSCGSTPCAARAARLRSLLSIQPTPAYEVQPDGGAAQGPPRHQAGRPDGSHEVLLVLDATTGQNELLQAKAFTGRLAAGIVLAKLDGTAKGGIVFAISESLHLPLRYLSVGEKADDLVPFEPEAFVEALFA
jgi:fused signal recognition particle receptor